MQIEQLKPIVEAALLAASQPMTVAQLGDLFGEADEVGHEQIARALESLAAECEGRGVELKEVASGFRYQVRQEVHPWISRMWTEKADEPVQDDPLRGGRAGTSLHPERTR